MALKRLIYVIFGWMIVSIVQASTAQTPITVEWMNSRERWAIQSVPEFIWLTNGDAILHDRYADDPVWEKLNPKTGQRTEWLNIRRLADSLRSHADPGSNIPSWPEEFTQDGALAAFVIQGDVFVVGTADVSVQRITETPADEQSVHFSPDGRGLAYIRQNDLYVFDLESRAERRLTFDGSPTRLNGTLGWLYWEEIFDREDVGYWWSPDSKRIAFLQTDESNVSVIRFQSHQDAVPREREQRYPKAGDVNPSVRLGMVDVSGSPARWIDGVAYEYIVRVDWLPNGDRLSFQTLNRAQTELNLYFHDLTKEKTTRILTETDSAWVNPNFDLVFPPSGAFFFWTSERDGYAHVYRYSMTGKLLNRVTSGAWCVRPAGTSDRSIVAVDEPNQWIYITSQEKAHTERHLYRVRFDGTKKKQMTVEPGTHDIHFSKDGNYFVDVFSDWQTPPGMWLVRSDGTRTGTIREPRLDLMSAFAIRPQRLTTIPARDGFPLPARFVVPRGFDPTKRHPVIIHTYGGPGAPIVANEWERRYFWFHQMLADAGYLVVYLDNRSASGISKTLENLVVYRQAGECELDDWVDAARWLKAQSYVDSARLGIWGWSGGGTATLVAMTRSKEFKAGIAVGAVTDWKYYDTKYTEATMKTPSVNPRGYETTSLLKYARDLHGRLLLVHGSADDNVHPQNMLAFADALIGAGIPFDMMVYPGRNHGISDLAARNHLFHLMLDFWKKRL